jgi:alpha-ketoglutarate-dependent 2,4-dichlorophenoxyacetate dioxygenase
MTFTLRKLTENIGAEVKDIDLTASISKVAFAQLRAALAEHAVLVFHDQEISDEQHVAFTEGLGRIEMTMRNDPIGDGGPVGVLTNLDENGDLIPPEDPRVVYHRGNGLWHSDGSFKRVPLRGSLLAAKVVPPEGGGTEFASLCAAYATLSEEKKASLEGLVAEHSLAHSRNQIAPNLMNKAFLNETPCENQVLVRTIPETGKKALLVGSYATHIIGLPLEEGKALLKELLDWSTQPKFVYSHKWRANDLVVYDNRCCLHRALPWDRSKYARVLHRTTLAGDGPTVV